MNLKGVILILKDNWIIICCVIRASCAMSSPCTEYATKRSKKEIKSLFWNPLTIMLIFPGRKSRTSSDQSVLIFWSKCL
ncbi:hypothetical protein OROHE_002225 [Orobanche hederae]